MTNQKRITLFVVVVLIVVAIWYLDSRHVRVNPNSANSVTIVATSTQTFASSSPLSTADILAIRAKKATEYPSAVEIVNPTGFVNTNGLPITLSQYIGKKIILIDFMTYSCINCQRTFPYLEAWYQKYKDEGLIVVGIHTPEFDFEKNINNVQAAMQRFGITFPVVLDSNYGTWNAYQNEYWPHEFVIDIDGYVREDHVGEGGYDNTEKTIQTLLDERDERLGLVPGFSTDLVNPSNVISQVQTNSPETYFGSNRNQYLGNGDVGKVGVQSFSLPTTFSDNIFYFGGSWDVESEYATSQSSGSSITYTFNATKMYFVAGSVDQTKPVMAEVTLDGEPVPSNLRGSDIIEQNGKTYIDVGSDRLYNLINGNSLMHHTLQITALGSGLQAYTFTFG